MRNIHVIPTDKPSRFFNTNEGKYHFREQYVPDTIQTCKNHNIYITSDEEISGFENNIWVIQGTRVFLWKNTMALVSNYKPRKIILTTDQDLINDGVQPIDDEFLEWFVDNPSCEMVEVIYSSLMKDYEYELLFPKEEPKSHIEYTNTDDCTSMIYNQQEEEQLPTKWFKTEQISTWIGKSITRITTEGESIDESKGGHGKLIVMHQCGENKEELISQLETMIYGLKEGFENFAN